MKKINTTIMLLLSLGFFVVGVATLPDYGINWDTINHLPRGQAYLNYYLTGNKDYSNLEPNTIYWQDESALGISSDVAEINRRSLYQLDGVTYNWLLEYDGRGHPPTSDIISSFFNFILFQKLGIVNDIDSYRVYGVLVASILVGLVYWWVSKKTNILSGVFAAVALASYPLFFAESHFNTEKDIPETVYWSLMIFAVSKGIRGKNYKWVLASGVFFGLALGTKFNILFVVFVILPWLMFVLVKNNYKDGVRKILQKTKKYKKLIAASIFAPVIGVALFILFWPYLWQDPIDGIGTVFEFYKTIGTTVNFDPRYLGPKGINTYPMQWILYTTPIIVLVTSVFGGIYSVFKVLKDRDEFYLLLLLWLLVPISRVTLPNSNIYGGVRQIMEYIPALAMLSGVGVYSIGLIVREKLKINRFVVPVSALLLFIPHMSQMSTIHPNQNVYFNSIIGGLNGAREKDLQSWGNSFGAAYRQGVEWLNENAEQDANIVYAFELIPNIPRIQLRQDFVLWNVHRSGYLQKGEYAISLTYDDTDTRSYYDSYLERFVEPSHQVVVDGVPISKVWHNVPENQKYSLHESTIEKEKVSWVETEEGLLFDMGQSYYLSRLEYEFDEDDCNLVTSAFISISKDGKMWERLYGVFPNEWLIPDPEIGKQPADGAFHEPFVGQDAQYIKFNISPVDACMRQVESAEVTVFTDAPWLGE